VDPEGEVHAARRHGPGDRGVKSRNNGQRRWRRTEERNEHRRDGMGTRRNMGKPRNETRTEVLNSANRTRKRRDIPGANEVNE
jgi:hypothetical protein